MLQQFLWVYQYVLFGDVTQDFDHSLQCREGAVIPVILVIVLIR